MNVHVKHDEASAVLVNGRPEGQIDYETRCNIRDLIRLYGFETARDMVAHFLNDEADRKPRQ